MVNDILEDQRQTQLISLKERSRDREEHQRMPRKTVKEKAHITGLGHQRARVRRDRNAHSNTIPQRKEKVEDTDQEFLPPVGVLLLKGRMPREPEEVHKVRMISLRVL